VRTSFQTAGDKAEDASKATKIEAGEDKAEAASKAAKIEAGDNGPKPEVEA
jgi:hypothetical protein